MTKQEFELRKLQIEAAKREPLYDFLKSIATLCTIIICIYLIFEGLKVIATANPDGISALAVVVKNLNISGIMSYIVAAGCATGWAYERKGKKRLLKGYGAKRMGVEANDAYHGSSGLTESGETPGGTE